MADKPLSKAKSKGLALRLQTDQIPEITAASVFKSLSEAAKDSLNVRFSLNSTLFYDCSAMHKEFHDMKVCLGHHSSFLGALYPY